MSASGSARAGLAEVLRLPEVRAVVTGSFVIMLGFGILAPVLPLSQSQDACVYFYNFVDYLKFS